jgi:Tfp pilus assembly protein PilV
MRGSRKLKLNSAQLILDYKYFLFSNSRGQSLVGVLISVAIVGVIVTTMASMFESQNREMRAIKEKLAAADLTRIVTQTLANPSVCSSVFASTNLITPGSIPFDASSVTYPHVIPIKSIPSAGVESGGQASALSSTLVLSPQSGSPSGLQLVFTNATTAALQVNFDQSKLVHAIQNLSLPVITTVSGGLTSVGACVPPQLRTWSKGINNSIPLPGVEGPAISCPAGMMVSSCTTLQTPNGNLVCSTRISTSGDSCMPGACTDPGFAGGQVWTTHITCIGMQ